MEEIDERTPEEILMDYKTNYAPKSELDEANAKYNRLFNEIASGHYVVKEDEDPDVDIKAKQTEYTEVLNKIRAHKANDLDFMKAMLLKDDILTSSGGRSAFVPQQGELTDFQIKAGERTRAALEQAVKDGKGRPGLTTANFREMLVGN